MTGQGAPSPDFDAAAEFVLERIDEEEQETWEAIRERRRVAPSAPEPDTALQARPDLGVPAVVVGPERTLAEVAAKRAIVARYREEARDDALTSGLLALSYVVSQLAAVHAHHPDYREEWRP